MATGSEDGQERATHLLDLPGDLLAKIMFGSRNSSPNELPLASCSGYLATIERTRDRHALYCTCRAIRENAAINSCISRLRLEVCEFNMDGTEAHPPFPHLAHSLRTFPKHARPLASLLLCKLGASGHERERAEDSGWGYAGDAPFFLDVWEGLINDPQTRAVLSDLHELTLQVSFPSCCRTARSRSDTQQ
uniref:F-box domain-containing protein n=2 Tax=Dunaliella tertiolecta TaxID=3047 RepID=A0A7S3QVE8_DUNTE